MSYLSISLPKRMGDALDRKVVLVTFHIIPKLGNAGALSDLIRRARPGIEAAIASAEFIAEER